MKKIKCPDCKKPLKVAREGQVDQSSYKKSTKGARVRWTKEPQKPAYLVRFACKNPNCQPIIAVGRSKADAHRAVNDLARRQKKE